MNLLRLYAITLLLLLATQPPAAAQSPALLRLIMSETALQTGQTYDVTIQVEGAPSVWVATAEIDYDPTQFYIIGTRAGSPVRLGALFPGESSLIARNAVERGRVVFTASLLSPAPPASGSGSVGTFRIYPLRAGAAQLTFSRVSITTFLEGSAQPQSIDVTPVLLDLTITGETVEPPDEATATPAPTETPRAALPQGERETEMPLVNITLAPVTATPTAPPAPAPVEPEGGSMMAAAIAAAVIGASGILVLLLVWLRRQR